MNEDKRYLVTIELDELIEASNEDEAKKEVIDLCSRGLFITQDMISLEEVNENE